MSTKHEINAEGKKLGRVASEAAKLLMGKNLSDYARNTIPDVKVSIINVAKLDMTAKKRNETSYAKYSGYPGGLRYESMQQVVSDAGYSEVMRRAVYGMLPTNRLRPRMMKNLTISE